MHGVLLVGQTFLHYSNTYAVQVLLLALEKPVSSIAHELHAAIPTKFIIVMKT